MKFAALIVLATLVTAPAIAQPITSPDPASRALQMTVNELTQAWVGARTALLQAQDQLTAAKAQIAALEAKLPRQEPIKGPSAMGAPVPSQEPAQ